MKLISISPSTRKDKKLVAIFERDNGRTLRTHFGQRGHQTTPSTKIRNEESCTEIVMKGIWTREIPPGQGTFLGTCCGENPQVYKRILNSLNECLTYKK